MAIGRNTGYVEDSEDEDIMTFDPFIPTIPKAVAGPSGPSAATRQLEGDTVSTLQTPDFTNAQAARPAQPHLPYKNTANITTSTIQSPNFSDAPSAGQLVRPPKETGNPLALTIQSPNFTSGRPEVSDISSFGPATRPGMSSIKSTMNPTSADSSISISTSGPPPPRQRPKPRPAYKKNDDPPTGNTSLATNSSGAAGVNSSFSAPRPSNALPEPHMGGPTHNASSSSVASAPASKGAAGKERVSDSGVDLMDIDMPYSHDVAERAKMRSRARTQSKAKAPSNQDDVIELSSEDELSMSPAKKARPKAKPKPKPKKSPTSDASTKVSAKKSKEVSVVISAKRLKTTHVPDPGFESDVNTIPVPTSDFSVHGHAPGARSSQLPPSDPPPSTGTSSSALSRPQTSQELGAPKGGAADRDLSPLSSPPPPLPRKRKRPNLPALPGLESDEESSSVDLGAGAKQPQDSAKSRLAAKELPVPPPVPSPSIVPETQLAAKPKPAPRKKRKDPLDNDGGGDAPAKPSKSRKKARVADDEDYGGAGAEDDDEDWGAPSGRAKAKAKKGAKKAPTKEKKGKGKSKDNVPPPKSKEIIDDSDEERDREAMPPPPVPVPASKGKDSPAKESRPSASKDTSSAPKKSYSKGAGKQRAVVLSDDEEADEANAADISTNSITVDKDSPAPPVAKKSGRKSSGGDQSSDKEMKENDVPASSSSSSSALATPAKAPPGRATLAHANRSYTIGGKSAKHTPMSELIRRASAQPGSPFPATARPVHSPLAKTSKSALRRIAPLHPHRRTPPPPPPRPPPPKKSKKMLELEEKWEMELEDTVEGWYAMSQEERAVHRRAKRDKELGFDD